MVLNAQLKFQPEAGTELGLDEYDEMVFDLGPDLFERTTAEDRILVGMTQEWLRTAEHPKVIQDLEILRQALEDGIHSAELEHKYMLPYFNLSQNLFFGFRALLDPRTDPERYPAALVRLMVISRSQNWQLPAPPSGLLGPYKGEIERDLNNVERFAGGFKGLFEASGLEDWEDDLGVLQGQLNAYADWLRSEMLPRAREDHRLPPELYADNLKNFGVRAKPQDLIRDAQFGFQEIKAEMRSVARQIANQRGWENGELMHVMQELKKNQIPQDRIIEVY